MPKFLYTLTIIIVGSWLALITYMNTVPPKNIPAALLWGIIFFIPTYSTISVLSYLFNKGKKSDKTDRELYRQGLKTSAILSIVLTSVLTIKIVLELIQKSS